MVSWLTQMRIFTCYHPSGYIVIASAQNVGALAVGIIFYAMWVLLQSFWPSHAANESLWSSSGFTYVYSPPSCTPTHGLPFLFVHRGFQLLLSILVADITTLKWRGLFSSLISAPFIINAFVGSNIVTQVLERSGWRWGYGMFAILIPATLCPLLATLFWAEQKARKLGLVPPRNDPSEESYVGRRVWNFSQRLDIIGLVLIGMSISHPASTHTCPSREGLVA